MKIQWEIFKDKSYYDMWTVRPEGDTDFESPRLFHVETMEEAFQLKELLNNVHVAEAIV